MESEVKTPVSVNFGVDHSNDAGGLIARLKTRDNDEVAAFSRLRLNDLWGDLLSYDTWRVGYCEKHRDAALRPSLREGLLDIDTVTYAVKLKLREMKHGTDSKSYN